MVIILSQELIGILPWLFPIGTWAFAQANSTAFSETIQLIKGIYSKRDSGERLKKIFINSVDAVKKDGLLKIDQETRASLFVTQNNFEDFSKFIKKYGELNDLSFNERKKKATQILRDYIKARTQNLSDEALDKIVALFSDAAYDVIDEYVKNNPKVFNSEVIAALKRMEVKLDSFNRDSHNYIINLEAIKEAAHFFQKIAPDIPDIKNYIIKIDDELKDIRDTQKIHTSQHELHTAQHQLSNERLELAINKIDLIQNQFTVAIANYKEDQFAYKLKSSDNNSKELHKYLIKQIDYYRGKSNVSRELLKIYFSHFISCVKDNDDNLLLTIDTCKDLIKRIQKDREQLQNETYYIRITPGILTVECLSFWYLSNLYQISNDHPHSIETGKKVLEFVGKIKLDRKFVSGVNLDLANSYFILNNFKEAEEYYQNAIEINSHNERAYLNYSHLLLKTDKEELAEHYLQKTVKTNPKSASAHFRYATFLQERKRNKEAEEHFIRAISEDPTKIEYHMSYGILLLDLDRKDKAGEHFNKAVEINPKFTLARLLLSMYLADIGEREKVEEQINKILEFEPQNTIALLIRTALFMDKGMIEDAQEQLKTVDIRLKSQSKKYDNAIYHSSSTEKIDEEKYQKDVELDPDNSNAQMRYANILSLLGKTAKAKEHFEKAIELDPKNADAHLLYGNMLTGLEQKVIAKMHFEKAIELDPNLAMAHLLYGNLLVIEGKENLAKLQFERAIEINPTSATSHLLYGNLLMRLEQIKMAKLHFEIAVELDPENADNHFFYGNILIAFDETEKAKEQFKKAIEINPKLAIAHLQYSILLKQSGSKEEAAEHYHRAVELDPGLHQLDMQFIIQAMQAGMEIQSTNREFVNNSFKAHPTFTQSDDILVTDSGFWTKLKQYFQY
jgi:tetratricopeptide (TPR) repeat protein